MATTIQFQFPECQKIELNSIVTRASAHGLILLEDLLRWDPEKRPNAQQSLKYSFFQLIPLPATVNNSRFESKSNFSMSPMESEHNKQMSRLSYFNNPQQNKIVQQKQMIIENNMYNIASNAAPAAVAPKQITNTETECDDDEGIESNGRNASDERENELTDSIDAAPIDSLRIKNTHNSKFHLNTQKNNYNSRQDNGLNRTFKLKEDVDESTKTDGKPLPNSFSQNNIFSLSNTNVQNNRNEDNGSSLNGSSIDMSQTRRFSIRRSSRPMADDNDFATEKISDIYVNRNVNSLYSNHDYSNDFGKSHTHHNKGFYLHNGPPNGQRLNIAEPKVYHVFTKQHSRDALLEKQRQQLDEENAYLATKLIQAPVKTLTKTRDTKRTSLAPETWGSFEEDELTSILG